MQARPFRLLLAQHRRGQDGIFVNYLRPLFDGAFFASAPFRPDNYLDTYPGGTAHLR